MREEKIKELEERVMKESESRSRECALLAEKLSSAEKSISERDSNIVTLNVKAQMAQQVPLPSPPSLPFLLRISSPFSSSRLLPLALNSSFCRS